MKNRDIYLKDPSVQKLVNEGVANVNDDKSKEALAVLRYELETFVCDGQYEKGLAHILETYLKNIDQAQQPAVWISGFYGSGKSHLVKMLRALWEDTVFEDGATARGIAGLPQHINDLLKELSVSGKRHGGLHAASGTLSAGAGDSVRLALLGIIFKSVGLPERYQNAQFVMWLRRENIYDAVKQHVIDNGADWEEEIDNLYVAETLHDALVSVKPQLFPSRAVCAETLNNLYPMVRDITSDEMIKAIRQALTNGKKFPLTAVILDEVQLYIGEDSNLSAHVQEVVESCCKHIGGKLLFIGTGQTAVTGIPILKRLEGRFTIRIELSDADVDAVVRKVILAKTPDAIEPVDKALQANIGEISRHLSDTAIGHRQEDVQVFSQDYPVLPVRRRFWEHTLRALDPTGADSQLRNQLSMIHKAVRTNLDEPLGHVIRGDYIYFDTADRLLQARALPRKVHEKTMRWITGSVTEQLTARACGAVYLINRLSAGADEIGIRATVDTVADLLIEDLPKGGAGLRNTLPNLMDKCELLMKVGDEYRIQTEESAAWNDDFLSLRQQLANEMHRLDAEREDRIRRKFGEIVKNLTPVQGNARVMREFYPVFNAQLPADADQKIHVWVRDGWNTDENSLLIDARQAGSDSPAIFVFVPKRSADSLRRYLTDFKAARATLDQRGTPGTPEGEEARAAMETTLKTAERRLGELLDDCFSGARVFQGGGQEIIGAQLRDAVSTALENALLRLYPQFQAADHEGWDRAYARAKKGAPDALKAVGFEGEPATHPVCKAILGRIAGGKKGAEIRGRFESPPFGWPRDAVDGALQALLVAGRIRVEDEKGHAVPPLDLERKALGKCRFKLESANVTTVHRIQTRKLIQKLGFNVKQGEEASVLPPFIEKMKELAAAAGGPAPQPEPPKTGFLEDIRLTAGNEQILAVYNQRTELNECIDQWRRTGDRIRERLPGWEKLRKLLKHAEQLKDIEVYQSRAGDIERKRLLLADPDPVAPIIEGLAQNLREILNGVNKKYAADHETGMERLRKDPNWAELDPDQRRELMTEQHLTENDRIEIDVGTTDAMLAALEKTPLSSLYDRLAAMSGRFDEVLRKSAELLEPEAQYIKVPSRLMKTEADIDQWIEEINKKLKHALPNGPIWIQ